jgi:hypothetical protein
MVVVIAVCTERLMRSISANVSSLPYCTFVCVCTENTHCWQTSIFAGRSSDYLERVPFLPKQRKSTRISKLQNRPTLTTGTEQTNRNTPKHRTPEPAMRERIVRALDRLRRGESPSPHSVALALQTIDGQNKNKKKKKKKKQSFCCSFERNEINMLMNEPSAALSGNAAIA